MSIVHARAFVDRASTKENGPLRVVLATEGVKADGIDLRMAGANLARFNANPIVGYGHSYGTRADLPVGRVDNISVEGDRLVGDVTFDPGDEFAMTLDRKYRSGIMSAFSVGFAVSEWESPGQGSRTGGVATSWDLHELSSVPVPMDSGAVVIGGRSLSGTDLTVELIEVLRELRDQQSLARAAECDCAGACLEKEPETPVVESLDPDAASAVLAAFTPKEGNAHE